VIAQYTWRKEDCAGHFPGNPVVPGVRMLAMAARTAGVSLDKMENVVFKKMVRPGETVACHATPDANGGADVEIKFLSGPKDGEVIFTGKISGEPIK
jgi:3-hydroxymyristoyl/3-hydroxydecanoyl-(acyl carrier protein) dehydratase